MGFSRARVFYVCGVCSESIREISKIIFARNVATPACGCTGGYTFLINELGILSTVCATSDAGGLVYRWGNAEGVKRFIGKLSLTQKRFDVRILCNMKYGISRVCSEKVGWNFERTCV